MHRTIAVVVIICFALGAAIMALASRRAHPAERHRRWIKLGTYIGIVLGVLLVARAGGFWFVALMGLIVVLGACEVKAALARAPHALLLPVGMTYFALCIAFLFGAAASYAGYVYLVVAAFDGFSQVCGQLLGQHRLAPRLSPGKTVEGALGGLVVGVVVAWLTRSAAGFAASGALAAGTAICVAALAGDLSASWLKRRAGIKDFSRLLPGHGGVLDRFDSYIAALGFCTLAFDFLPDSFFAGA